MTGCCECGDEPPDSGATELVKYLSVSNILLSFDGVMIQESIMEYKFVSFKYAGCK
jgi:hypothetical protein